MVFLSAEWRRLIPMNFPVPDEVLVPHQPTGAERSTGGGPVALPMGQDWKPIMDRQTGMINGDKVFEINELVNPVRQ